MEVKLSYVYYDHELSNVMSRVQNIPQTCKELAQCLQQGPVPNIFTQPCGDRVKIVVEFVVLNVKMSPDLNEEMSELYNNSRSQLRWIEKKAYDIVKAKDLTKLGKL